MPDENDYTYDEGEAVQLDNNDRSLNGASSLDGYDINIRTDGDWPGLDGSGSEMRMDTEGVDAVVAWLTSQVTQMQSLAEDMQTTQSANFGPNSWLEAVQLREASLQVARTVNRYSNDLVANLQNAADAINRAKGNITGADQRSGQAADNVSSNIGGQAPGAGGGGTPSRDNTGSLNA